MTARKEPRRVPDWVTWPGCALAFVGVVISFRPLAMVGGALSIWWLVQHIRWTNWDVARRVEAMKDLVASDESQ